MHIEWVTVGIFVHTSVRGNNNRTGRGHRWCQVEEEVDKHMPKSVEIKHTHTISGSATAVRDTSIRCKSWDWQK